MSINITPKAMASSFTCPFCNTTSKQEWFFNSSAKPAYSFSSGRYSGTTSPSFRSDLIDESLAEWGFAQCDHCNSITVWHKDALVFPRQIPVEQPSADMPEKVAELYREAAEVLALSPRSSAALLRLALQILLEDILGNETKNTINENIKLLMEKDVSNQVIKALDVIRVFGNESVHPGCIDLSENADNTEYLFAILNLIVEALYSQPRRLDELFEMIPEQKRNV